MVAAREMYVDPLEELFIAQFARPAELRPVNLRAISPNQRALLSIDGTVTTFAVVADTRLAAAGAAATLASATVTVRRCVHRWYAS